MNRLRIVLLLSILLPTPALADLLIDDYEVGPFSVTDNDTTIVFTRVTLSGLDPAHVLGGERTVFVNTPAPGLLTTFDLASTSGDDSAFCSMPQGGASCGTEALNLGSLDLTQSGSNDRFRVVLTQVSGPGTFFSVRVSTGTGDGIAQQFVNAPGTYEIFFADLFGAPDLTEVQEVAVGLGGDAGSLMAISEFSAAGTHVVPAMSDLAGLMTAGLMLLLGGALERPSVRRKRVRRGI